MSSKRGLILRIASGLLAIGVAACGIRLNQIPGSLRNLQISGSEYGCLSGSGEFFSKYLNGLTTEKQVSEFWNCASDALKSFAEQTRGQNEGFYRPEELRNFLQTYFLKVPANSTDEFIPNSLLFRAMEFKSALLGGRTDQLTVAEIERMRALISLFRDESLRLRGYLPLKMTEKMYARGSREIDEAADILRTGSERLGVFIAQTAKPYSLDLLDALLSEIKEFSRQNEIIVSVHSQMPSLKAAKAILGRSDPTSIGASEWPELLSTAARWYGVFAKLGHSFHAYPSTLSGDGRVEMVKAFKEAVTLLTEALNRHPGKIIAFDELDRFIDTYFGQGITVLDEPESSPPRKVVLTATTIKAMLRPLFRNLLAGGSKINGVNQIALGNFLQPLVHWNEGQKYIETLFAKSRALETEGRLEFDLGRLFSFQAVSAPPSAVETWIASLLKYPSFFQPGDEEMHIETGEGELRHSESEISRLHLYREVVRVLIYGYADDRSRAFDPGFGATLQGFRRFYSDFKQLGIELKFLSREDPLAPTKRFREANLFTYAGNGDQYVDPDEGGQLLAFMISGKKLANRIHNDLMRACTTGDIDPYEIYTIEPDCYRDKFFGETGSYFDKIPGLQAYFASLSPERKAAFRWTYEEAARKRGRSDNWFNTSDSEGFATLALYLETVFARFDRSRVGALSLEDAKAAFPVFRNTLKELAQKMLGKRVELQDEDLETIFTYMLAHGEPPDGKLSFIIWKLKRPVWSLEADRAQIINIFATLGKSYVQ